MHIELPYGVIYKTKLDVPVPLVAKSLYAHERLIRESVGVLDQLYPQIEISVQSITVRSITNGSPLNEILAVGLFLTFQEDLESEIPVFIEKLIGVDIPQSADTFITVLVMLIATKLITATVERVYPGKSVAKLEASYERKLELLSEEGIDKDQIDAYLQHRYETEQPKSLVTKALEFFSPAKNERNVDIETSSGEELASWEAIDEIPDTLFPVSNDTKSYPMDNVSIEVHRSDKDQNRHGWRGIVPSLSGKKVRMVLHKELDPSSLYGAQTLRVDIAVVEKLNADGEMEPAIYYINQIRNTGIKQ